MSNNIDDYIQRGIHGDRETKPSERRRYLGTIRERIVIALTQMQVGERGIYTQVEDAIKKNRQAHLYLNGNMEYVSLSKYIQIATKYDVNYTMVTNKEHDSEIGLVLAYDDAIDKEKIYVEKRIPKAKPEKGNDEKGLFTVFKNLFRTR